MRLLPLVIRNGWLPMADEVASPFSARMADWTEWDDAAALLGQLIGVIPSHYSRGSAKAFLTVNYSPGQDGRKLILLLNLMADIGLLEMRDNYREFRWPQAPRRSA